MPKKAPITCVMLHPASQAAVAGMISERCPRWALRSQEPVSGSAFDMMMQGSESVRSSYARSLAEHQGVTITAKHVVFCHGLRWLADWQDVRCAEVHGHQADAEGLNALWSEMGLAWLQGSVPLLQGNADWLGACYPNPWRVVGQSMRAVLNPEQHHADFLSLHHESQMLMHQDDGRANGLWLWGGHQVETLERRIVADATWACDHEELRNLLAVQGREVVPMQDAPLDETQVWVTANQHPEAWMRVFQQLQASLSRRQSVEVITDEAVLHYVLKPQRWYHAWLP